MCRHKASQDERKERKSNKKNIQHQAILPSQGVVIIARFI